MMSKRFTAAHSPTSPSTSKATASTVKAPYRGKKRTRVGGRLNLLFLAPIPLAFIAFFGTSEALFLRLLAFATLTTAAWLTREGVKAHEAFDARKIARRPAFPRKLAASILTGTGLLIASLVDGNMTFATLFGAIGFSLHLFAFGLDPMRNKGMDDLNEFQTDRVARAVSEAETHLVTMQLTIEQLNDRNLNARVEQFCSVARDMFRTVEDDPRDLTAARKYLGVYLHGARDATRKFVDIYLRDATGSARGDYEALLDDLEANFTARTQQFLNDNRTDLDVEIEVLRERLAREGVNMS